VSFHEDGNTSFRVTCCSSHPIERTRPTPVVVGETEMIISTLVTRGWNISNNRSGDVDLMSWSLWTIAAKRLQPLLEPGGGRRGPWPAISCQVEK